MRKIPTTLIDTELINTVLRETREGTRHFPGCQWRPWEWTWLIRQEDDLRQWHMENIRNCNREK